MPVLELQHYLFGWKYWNVVFIYKPCFFFNGFLVLFLLQVFTRQPEQEVLFTILCSKKLSEDIPTSWRFHHFVKILSPGQDFICSRVLAAKQTQKVMRKSTSWFHRNCSICWFVFLSRTLVLIQKRLAAHCHPLEIHRAYSQVIDSYIGDESISGLGPPNGV